MVKNSLAKQETLAWSLGWENPLEKEIETRFIILAWEITWTEEPGQATVYGITRQSDTTEWPNNNNCFMQKYIVLKKEKFFSCWKIMYECIQNLYSISFLLFRGFTTDLGGGILQEFTARNLKLFCKDSCRLRMESWSFCCYLCWCSPISLEDWINFFLLGYDQVGGIFFFFFMLRFCWIPACS